MNYIQKMGIDLNTPEGLGRVIKMVCDEIPDDLGKKSKELHICPVAGFSGKKDIKCADCRAQRLLAEVPMTKKTVKRWETYEGDFTKASERFTHYCETSSFAACRFDYLCTISSSLYCFAKWLMEEVEVEDGKE